MSTFNLPAATVISWFPENRNRSLMSDMDFYTLMAMDLGFSTLEGNNRVTQNGHVIKDSVTLDPAKPEKVIGDYFNQRKWMKPSESPEDLNNLSSFSKHYEEKTGRTALGAEFYDALNSHVKSKKNFDYYT